MKVDISIVIVNYNVQYFIEQCLNSIYNLSDFAGKVEVIVVDNASTDGSLEMIRSKYSDVHLISNTENVGFSKANNQAIVIANGNYVLLLNPDTILEEKTLSKCFEEMEMDKSISVIGVKMLDGSGKFLPESKRGFPSPLVSFYRFIGAGKIFPKSKIFNKYYLGNIDENQTADVDILCGAFMFIRKTDLDEVGNLDEDFFMYGEDIDLSYRFKKAKKRILYFPETRIIHFKGESTKKNSIQYTTNFYQAMDIFAKKHFKDSRAKTYLRSLSIVIKLKGAINVIQSSIGKILLPILDLIFIFFGLHGIAYYWAKIYFGNSNYYDQAPLSFNFSIYSGIWILALLYAGAYDKQISFYKICRNVFVGTLIILAVYGLLGEEFRSSRALILISNFYVIGAVVLIRLLLSFLNGEKLGLFSKGKNVLLLASESEALKIKNVLKSSDKSFSKIIVLPASISAFELNEVIKLQRAREVICNVKELGMEKVISLMSTLGDKADFKITGDKALAIIGSRSKNKSGEIYTAQINYNIHDSSSRRLKRTFDLLASIFLIVFFPVLVFRSNYRRIFSGIFLVILAYKTIIGYNYNDERLNDLPLIKKGLINTIEQTQDLDQIHRANFDYAKHYSVFEDLKKLSKFIL